MTISTTNVHWLSAVLVTGMCDMHFKFGVQMSLQVGNHCGGRIVNAVRAEAAVLGVRRASQ